MKKHISPLIDYMKSLDSDSDRDDFALRCGTTLGYLKLIMYGNRNCSAITAINIDRESNGYIPCDILCPQADFEYIRQQVKSHLAA